MMFHMLEFMDVEYELDLEKIHQRWTDFDNWTQLIMKQTDEPLKDVVSAPSSGIWQMQEDGDIKFSRQSIDWHSVDNEDEAFFLRIYGKGDTLFKGADVGILVSRGQMQHPDGELTERARRWTSGIHRQFVSTPHGS